MARIRTVKPEFYAHEDLSFLPAETHLLAGALLNYADDEGFFKAHPQLVKAGCSPLRGTPDSVFDSLKELEGIGYVRLFIGIDGKQYGFIVNFKEHQRVDKPKSSKIKTLIPDSDDSEICPGLVSDDSEKEGKGREGNRKGNEGSARSVLEYLNKQAGRQYRPVPANLKFICARLDEYDEATLKRVVDDRVSLWANDAKMSQYLRPETLFNETKCAQYVGLLPQAKNGAPAVNVADVYDLWVKLGMPEKLRRKNSEPAEAWKRRIEEAA